MKIFNNPYMWSAFLTASLSANPTGVLAAPGPIANSPLFLSAAVQPNIFFLVDDLGSMGWEILRTGGGVIAQGPSTSGGNVDFTPESLVEDLEHCPGFNAMAYDPSTTYTPWDGVDINGNAYTNQSLGTALKDPYNPADGTRNLLDPDATGYAAFYGQWVDANNDTFYDAGECPSVAANGSFTSRVLSFTDPRFVFVNTLSPTEKTNYANWHTYYRKRAYVVKRALSSLISGSTYRLGLGTLHDNNNVGTEIKDVDDITLPVNATAQANKTALLRQLFRVTPKLATPLRKALRNVGNYFAGSGPVGDLFGGATPPDPILPAADGGACQQNFAVVLSDGFWNGNNPSVGNTDADGAGPWDGGAYADSDSETLADVAMKYYETDLDPSLPPNVPTIPGVDNNNEQHMVTYTVAFGVDGTLAAGPPAGASSFAWPTPLSNKPETIDDMRHAAYNGRGLFLNAKHPQTLIDALNAAFSDIQARTGTAAAVAFNSTSVQANSKVFRASFNSNGWHGNLEALNLSATGALTPAWDAASRLDARNLSTDPRNIVTYNGTTGASFNWPADYNNPGANGLGSSQIADLLSNAPFPTNTSVSSEIAANKLFGQNILKYHRGDFTNEGSNASQFRARNGHRLGDIVHASPFFVAEPNTAYPDALEGTSNLYSSFKTLHANRPARLYAGANDGMLHVFDASGTSTAGEEVFAYMPGLIFSSNANEGLHSLAEQSYKHRYYVDLTPAVADVFIDTDGIGSGLPASWKTVLVGGLRAGGKGIFALDVTNPSNLTEANAANIPLWEFTHKDLGFTFSEIQIARLHNGKWAAIFGNGYNNDPTGDGRAKLFIHYLDGSGTVILDTQAGSMVNNDCSDVNSDCNGLSTPALADLNGDAIIDRVYAGDLHGNLWVFDISDANSSNWDFAYKDASSNPSPLFQACTAAPCTTVNRQPITSRPALARHPNRSSFATSPNILAYVGTGQYITSTDNASAAPQSFYGVWDGGTFGITPRTSPLTRSDLVSQTITEPTPGQRILTQNSVNYDPSAVSPLTPEYGWKIDLPTSKERVIVDSIVIGDILFFNTLHPSVRTCSGGGSGFLMNVDMLTGGLPNFAVIDGNNDGDFSNDPVLGGQIVNSATTASRFINNGTGKFLRITGSGGVNGNNSGDSGRGTAGTTARRISWRHLDY